LEEDFRPMLCGNFLMFLNCVAQANLVTIDFEESGGAFLAEHDTDDSDEGGIWLLDGGGLINNANLVLLSDVQQSRNFVRLGVDVSKIPQRPGKPLELTWEGGLMLGSSASSLLGEVGGGIKIKK
jgi:hypothetical protein